MPNCKQTKCIFLGTPACPVCEECSAEPNIVDENCVRCWNCERDEGELRGFVGKSSLSLAIAKKVEEKLLEIKDG